METWKDFVVSVGSVFFSILGMLLDWLLAVRLHRFPLCWDAICLGNVELVRLDFRSAGVLYICVNVDVRWEAAYAILTISVIISMFGFFFGLFFHWVGWKRFSPLSPYPLRGYARAGFCLPRLL